MIPLMLAGCLSMEPTFVSQVDIDRALRAQDPVPVCAGLKQKDAAVRTYAAQRLRDWPDDGAACLCDRAVREGQWDAAIFEGLKGSTNDARVGCLSRLLDDPALPDRPGLVGALLGLRTPSVRARLVEAAKSDRDPAVRAAAVVVLRDAKDAGELAWVIDAFPSAPADFAVSAATVLAGRPEAAGLLRDAARAHPDPRVRSAALQAYQPLKAPDFPELLCHAVNEAADAGVRQRAIEQVKSSRDPAVLACLRTRALTREEDPTVRLTLLRTLARNASPEAAAVLCDAIPFWVRSYVGETAVQPQSAEDIVYYQNDRDFERTYDCVKAAWKAGGYSVCGRAYVGAYLRQYGERVSFKACGGAGGSSGGGHEITF